MEKFDEIAAAIATTCTKTLAIQLEKHKFNELNLRPNEAVGFITSILIMMSAHVIADSIACFIPEQSEIKNKLFAKIIATRLNDKILELLPESLKQVTDLPKN